MLAFPGMLVQAAKKAGISVPGDPDDFDKEEFPHFGVFVKCQIGKSTRYHGEHWDNAHVIAELSDNEIRSITIEELIAKGFSY